MATTEINMQSEGKYLDIRIYLTHNHLVKPFRIFDID